MKYLITRGVHPAWSRVLGLAPEDSSLSTRSKSPLNKNQINQTYTNSEVLMVNRFRMVSLLIVQSMNMMNVRTRNKSQKKKEMHKNVY